ncbi:MAG TPA: helix-turn-helix transcriptional regulator [Symbiobacteriaceae bacterium]|nr:helix-turn-helix transcriptional regulator [Symbiobacteriaceae bacterium]
MGEEGKVVGHLLKWAREQQELTMRDVQLRGGPAPGYQSEVENGQKGEVSAEKLYAWCRTLTVTPAFARGQVPRLEPTTPGRCRGLAGWIEPEVRQNLPEFEALLPIERFQRVLKMIATSAELPIVVLAYVMAMDVSALKNLLYEDARSLYITEVQLKQVAVLTAMPTRFFKLGKLCEDD